MTSGTNGGFAYAAFGLRLRSALALPELARLADDPAPADVVIERGRVPERLDGAVDVEPAMQVAARDFQLGVPVGRFRVSEGRRVVVDPRPGASDAEQRPYLLGTVMGALCYQRSLLPLHAAAVLFGEGAVAFAGPSGVGKSTLAAQFLGRGRSVLADDLLAVDVERYGAVAALPGLARIRLRSDSARAGDGKVSLPIPGPRVSRPWPLRRLYVLRAGGADPPELCRLRGPEAVGALLDQVYRWPVAKAAGRGPAVFAQCVSLVRGCEIFQASFTHAAGPPALARALERHLTP